MFRLFILLSFVLAPLAFLTHPVSAATVNVKTKSGRSVSVTSYGNFNKGSCASAALPRFKVTRKPKHGQFRHVARTVKITNKGRCKGKSIKAIIVIYTPEKGFRGQDSGQVSFTHFRYTEGAATRHVGVKVNVTVE